MTEQIELIDPIPPVRQDYSIYEVSTGNIIAALNAIDEVERDANVQEGQGWVAGHYDPALWYVAQGLVVAYPPRPQEWMTFNYETGLWVDARGAAELVDERARLLDALTSKVIALRNGFITDIPGQEMIYLRKEQEGIAYLALPEEPEDLTMFPLLAAEVGITAPTAFQVATIWVQLSAMWLSAAAQLEQFRLGMAAQIEAAGTFEDLAIIEAQLSG